MTKPLAELPAPPFPGPSGPAAGAITVRHGLTAQEQLWVKLYRETGDAMASCVRAKMFSPEYPTDVLAMKTLERPEIQAAIAELDQAEREAVAASQVPAVRQSVEITREVILADLQEVFEVAMGNDFTLGAAVAPVSAKPGTDAAALLKPRNLGAAIAAKKVQASMIGALRQTVDVNFHMKRAEDMTDEELDRIIRQGKAKDAEFEEVKEEGGE